VFDVLNVRLDHGCVCVCMTCIYAEHNAQLALEHSALLAGKLTDLEQKAAKADLLEAKLARFETMLDELRSCVDQIKLARSPPGLSQSSESSSDNAAEDRDDDDEEDEEEDEERSDNAAEDRDDDEEEDEEVSEDEGFDIEGLQAPPDSSLQIESNSDDSEEDLDDGDDEDDDDDDDEDEEDEEEGEERVLPHPSIADFSFTSSSSDDDY